MVVDEDDSTVKGLPSKNIDDLLTDRDDDTAADMPDEVKKKSSLNATGSAVVSFGVHTAS